MSDRQGFMDKVGQGPLGPRLQASGALRQEAGAVLVDMHPGEIQRVVRHDLAGVSHAVGATSFMGAMALQDPTAMTAVMAELKRADLFFLETRTSSGSVASERAATAGVLTLRVDQRLEALGGHDLQVRAMARQLEAAVDLARRRGYAIVLVHPEAPAFAVLSREVPRLERSGVRFARVSSLLEPNAF